MPAVALTYSAVQFGIVHADEFTGFNGVFGDGLPRQPDAGIIVAFGYSDRAVPRYLMTTRTVLETRLYRLFNVTDDPLTLRGELSFNGGIGRTYNVMHTDPLHPDYQVELVRIGDDEDAE